MSPLCRWRKQDPQVKLFFFQVHNNGLARSAKIHVKSPISFSTSYLCFCCKCKTADDESMSSYIFNLGSLNSSFIIFLSPHFIYGAMKTPWSILFMTSHNPCYASIIKNKSAKRLTSGISFHHIHGYHFSLHKCIDEHLPDLKMTQ